MLPVPVKKLKTQQQVHINTFVPREYGDSDMAPLSYDAIRNHMWVQGAPGVGKTAGIFNALIWPRFYAGLPNIIIDPMGHYARWMLFHIGHYPKYLHPYLLDRIVYIPRGAPDYVVPTGLHVAHDEQETLYATANRLVEVIAMMDPHLVTASVEGMNAIREAGIYTGQIAASMQLPISAVAEMLTYPEKWIGKVGHHAKQNPELKPALAYLRELNDLGPAIRARKTGSFKNKLLPFLTDPVRQTEYGTCGQALDFDRHIDAGDTIIFDYSHITDQNYKQFAMTWDFKSVFDWTIRRGVEGHDDTMALFLIDECDKLCKMHAMEYSILADDISELATQWARNTGMALCCLNQSTSQLPKAVVTALSLFGTKIIMNMPNLDDAEYMSRLIYEYDPHLVRKFDKVWVNDPIPEYHPTGFGSGTIFARANFRVIDVRTTEYTMDEQFQLVSQRIQNLPQWHAIIVAAKGEGQLIGIPKLVSFEPLVNGHFPDNEKIAVTLAELRRQRGVLVERIRSEHTPHIAQTKRGRNRRGKPKKQDAILNSSAQNGTKAPSRNAANDDATNRHLPVEKKARQPTKTSWKRALWQSWPEENLVHKTGR